MSPERSQLVSTAATVSKPGDTLAFSNAAPGFVSVYFTLHLMESEELDFAAQQALVYVAVYFLVERSDVLQRSSASGAKSPPELLLLPTLSNL